MVSLANGNADVLSKAIVDSVGSEANETDSSEDQNNATAEQESPKTVWYRFVPKQHVLDRNSLEVTDESQSEMVNSVTKTLVVEALDKSENAAENTEKSLCNGSDSLTLPSVSCETVVNGKKNSTDLVCTTPISTISTPNVGNIIFVGNLKNIGKGDGQRKVYLVNSNMLTGAGATEMPIDDQGNFSVTTNLNDIIKKMKVVSSNSDIKTLKSITTLPSFVQLSQSNMKNISKNITLNITPTSTNSVVLKPNTSTQSFEILRNKLMESRVENSEPVVTEFPAAPVKHKTVVKTSINPHVFITKTMNESPAVTDARNEFIKCRKKLIEAAIFPRLATKMPLSGYVGPTFTCEECEDTFVSEESLKSHKDRRSVLFTYACPSCKQTLEFYNRCMFLLHVRSHDSAVKACYLTISTIPAKKLKFPVLDDDEDSLNGTEERVSKQTSASQVPSVAVPVIREILTNPVEKTVDFSTVSTVKSLENKTQSSNTLSDEDANDELFQNEPSSLRSLLVSETESSQTKSLEENCKSDDAIPIVPRTEKSPSPRRRKSSEGATKSKSARKQLVSRASLEPEANYSSKVTPCEIKTSSVHNNVEEIKLTSSDEEEEDSLPDSKDANKLVTCRECKMDVRNLTLHYRGDNRPKKDYPCEQCKHFNSSACALSAHVRMHTKTQPYVCPDCGYFFSTLETFLVHVKQVCFYDFKAIRFKCPVCSALKPSVPKFAEHLLRDHTREVYKCDACMTSSYSAAVVEAHIKRMHSNTDKPISILKGYWCKLCPNILVSKPLISHHINKHVYSLQHLRYVYICKMCKNYASLRRTKFANHYHNNCLQAAAMIAKARIRKPNRLRKQAEKKSTEAFINLRKAEDGEVKEVVEKDPLSVEEWETDKLKTGLGSTGNVCVMCRSTKVNEHSSLFCRQCVHFVDAEDANSASETTTTEGVSRFKRKFKCKLCKQYMNRDWSTITKHFEMYHHSDFNVRNKIRNPSTDPNSQTVAANRKRKMLTKMPENAKVLKADSLYQCVKCNTMINGRQQFHEHIATHKSQSDFQCLECGLCFIVRLSLEKHLIVEHKIRPGDLKEYFKANGTETVEEKVEERTLVENQCEVCSLECGTKQSYDKHIRTHGMAFVAMQSKAKT